MLGQIQPQRWSSLSTVCIRTFREFIPIDPNKTDRHNNAWWHSNVRQLGWLLDPHYIFGITLPCVWICVRAVWLWHSDHMMCLIIWTDRFLNGAVRLRLCWRLEHKSDADNIDTLFLMKYMYSMQHTHDVLAHITHHCNPSTFVGISWVFPPLPLSFPVYTDTIMYDPFACSICSFANTRRARGMFKFTDTCT